MGAPAARLSDMDVDDGRRDAGFQITAGRQIATHSAVKRFSWAGVDFKSVERLRSHVIRVLLVVMADVIRISGTVPKSELPVLTGRRGR
jgi:hypothetical protein